MSKLEYTQNLSKYYQAVLSKLVVESIELNDKIAVFNCLENTVAPKFNKLVWLEMNKLVCVLY